VIFWPQIAATALIVIRLGRHFSRGAASPVGPVSADFGLRSAF
jgi:hypothetical protein